MRVAPLSRLAAVVSAVMVVATLGTVAPAAAALGPSVQVVLSGGAPAHGPLHFRIVGRTDPAQHDRPSDFVLLVDGVSPWLGSLGCGSKDLDPDPDVCAIDVVWDTTGVNADVVLQAEFRTNDNLVALSAPVTVTAVNPAPKVQIDSPVDAATVRGITSVTVTGSVDPGQTDRPSRLDLLIGDGGLGFAADCATRDSDPSPYTCTTTFSWDTAEVTGSFVLQARLTTNDLRVAASTPITVSVDNLGTAVHIVSPVSQTLVRGVTPVVVTGSVDPAQADQPDRFVLLQDGSAIPGSGGKCSTQDTDPDPDVCTVSIPWDVRKLAYGHTVSAEFFTVGKRSARSAAVAVQVFGVTTTTLIPHKVPPVGQHFFVVGSVTAEGTGIPGMRVRVVYKPVLGKPQSVETGTDYAGAFTTRFLAVSNATITATVVGNSQFSASVGTVKVPQSAPSSCTLNHRTVQVGVADPGQCVVPGLPKGTPMAVQCWKPGHGWVTLLRGTSPANGKIRFTFRSNWPDEYAIRLYTAANRAFAKTWAGGLNVWVVSQPGT